MCSLCSRILGKSTNLRLSMARRKSNFFNLSDTLIVDDTNFTIFVFFGEISGKRTSYNNHRPLNSHHQNGHLNDFKGISSLRGLFYAKRLRNCFNCRFILTFLCTYILSVFAYSYMIWKFFYLIQIIYTQIYGFKYSYNIKIIYIQ